ncbi:glutamine--fructose-6-phosphate aminotransferase [isomerizing] 2-like [Camellia sinensis]|uniref:glutamine--fructose-6-phosphate aminotransferase [isomerizing] 2-like n=1 Tax=Camellia sinensis TaxID=4442 RepID=UPI0010368A8C|nr:glutamine--fructose-6-phosphate aminotransferase [isomerizing] 2-like [Camellia sinensis]XP_028067624.1 glutamine--fructose-6-phosphate aminotransferase [isomerizing] 2-like [Camellia sinensis]
MLVLRLVWLVPRYKNLFLFNFFYRCRILSLSHDLCQQAYTSQIVVMVMLALAIGGDTISSQARREAIIDGLFELPSKVREVLKLDQEMKDLAKLLIAEQSLLVFGTGYNYATALEGALKVKEVALMHSESILAGEMKHGPLALVDKISQLLSLLTVTLVSASSSQLFSNFMLATVDSLLCVQKEMQHL